MTGLFIRRICLGKEGIPFAQYKVRTMDEGAEQRLEEVVRNGLDGLGKPKDDPRITRVGRLLRRYWVDEIPQLYLLGNAVKLVGIRPKSEGDWKSYPEHLKERALQQKPGLLGIHYAWPHIESFKQNEDIISDYLEAYEQDPRQTDRKYLCGILRNIFFGKTRSR